LTNAEIDTIFFSGVSTTDPVDLIRELLGEDVIEYTGDTEFDVALPTLLRLGGGYQATDFLRVGATAAVPFNDVAGAYASALISIGAEVNIAKVLKLSAGTAFGGGYNTQISGGIGLDLGFWEIGLASRDITTLFGQESPTVSMAAGILRFKI
jgi:hypothetical protein